MGYLFLLVLIEHLLVLTRVFIVGGQRSKARWVAHLAERKSHEESESKKTQEVINQNRFKNLEKKLTSVQQKNAKMSAAVKNLTEENTNAHNEI